MNYELRIKNVKIKAAITLLIAPCLLLLAFTPTALSQTMTNSQYVLEMGNLNSFAGKPSNSSYRVSFSGGQSGTSLFSGPNYKVKLGFQYIYPLTPFRFTISSTLIDLGVISPTIPVTRTNQLIISNTSAHGYQVTVSQNHNLRVNYTGQEIPSTACDAGTCTPSTAALWTNALTYGFGYRCDNVISTDCDTQFSSANFYKPFAASPSAAIIMSSVNSGDNKTSTITYKVNIPQSQSAGLYTNILNYIATPTY